MSYYNLPYCEVMPANVYDDFYLESEFVVMIARGTSSNPQFTPLRDRGRVAFPNEKTALDAALEWVGAMLKDERENLSGHKRFAKECREKMDFGGERMNEELRVRSEFLIEGWECILNRLNRRYLELEKNR